MADRTEDLHQRQALADLCAMEVPRCAGTAHRRRTGKRSDIQCSEPRCGQDATTDDDRVALCVHGMPPAVAGSSVERRNPRGTPCATVFFRFAVEICGARASLI